LPTPCGVARALYSEAIIRYGTVGQTDLYVLDPFGHSIFVEIKTGSGKLSKEQENFQRQVERRNATHLIIRELKDAIDFVMKKYNITPSKQSEPCA